MKNVVLSSILIALLLLIAAPSSMVRGVSAATQDATPRPPQSVKIKVADGLEIVGDFYPTPLNTKAPAVLLLHQDYGRREQWNALTPILNAHGYNVLVIDQRGFGKTGGTRDWKQAERDDVALLSWLRQQPNVDADRVAVVGASVGAMLSLRLCNADKQCHVAVSLSPGLSYSSITTDDAIKTMENKSVLLVASQYDNDAATAVKQLISSAPKSANIMTKLYGDKRSHGVDMLIFPDLIPTIVDWLDTYNHP